MTTEKLTHQQIAQLANDVREIKKFQDESLNNGFDSTLFVAKVVPNQQSVKNNKTEKKDWPLILMCSFLFIFACMLVPRFVIEVPQKLQDLLLVGCLISGTLVVFASNLKFKDKGTTIILSIGLFVAVAIGFGVLTPKEAFDEAKKFVE